ncbi:MAG: hypothetical protein M3Y41_08920 [Pseudomonadota bacterium]|nr:hypothetical protein [Pseudomonadota bacterium]
MAGAAREILVPADGAATRWNEFDAEWYRRAYALSGSAEEMLQDYLEPGQALGRSPNIFFDELWYRKRNIDVAKSVAEGRFASGFDHYCGSGRESRSPHWLFNPRFYEAESPIWPIRRSETPIFSTPTTISCASGVAKADLAIRSSIRASTDRRWR